VIIKRDDRSRGLTCEERLALPAAVDLETANRALSLSRTTGYELAKCGRYPCTVLRLGNAYRVVTADLLKLLHIDVHRWPRATRHTSSGTVIGALICEKGSDEITWHAPARSLSVS
jgi:hypothetical protein